MSQPAKSQPLSPPEPPPDPVDEASEESFPASDPPAWQPLHPGGPADHPDPPHEIRSAGYRRDGVWY